MSTPEDFEGIPPESADEANAFTSAFKVIDADHPGDNQLPHEAPRDIHNRYGRYTDPNPLSSANDDWTGDPEIDRLRLVARAYEAMYMGPQSSRQRTFRHEQSGLLKTPRSVTGWLKKVLGL